MFRARALALQKLGRFRESLADVARALELEPKAANMLVRRGWPKLLQAKQLAEADFDAAVTANPENADAWNGRGFARIMMADVCSAVHDAEVGFERATAQAATQGAAAWPHIYNAATIYAQAVRVNQAEAEVSPDMRATNEKKFTNREVEIILQAKLTAGRGQQAALMQTVKTDKSLDPIRDSPKFRQAFGPRSKPEP